MLIQLYAFYYQTKMVSQGKGEEELKLAEGGKESPGSNTTAERARAGAHPVNWPGGYC